MTSAAAFDAAPPAGAVDQTRPGDGIPIAHHRKRNGALATTAAHRQRDAVGGEQDVSTFIDDLRLERYPEAARTQTGMMTAGPVRSAYHAVRPWLPVAVRKHLQRVGLRGWERLSFPRWPVDTSVEHLLDAELIDLHRRAGQPVPFIWFWPDGASCAVMMTHDVETEAGLDACDALMVLDECHGIPAAFQVVPEGRYPVSPDRLASFRARGFEANVHDLNHDGRLFDDARLFRERARRINEYLARFASRGFRSAVMYRRQEWMGAIAADYDMSVPNVAHLDPQRGGCCTVFPYAIGGTLELPLTTTQDYSLFHILNEYSTVLWRRQCDAIRACHGLLSFNVHPDYVVDERARRVYVELLVYLEQLRDVHAAWLGLPGDIERWWRQRSALQLVPHQGSWRIEGEGHERARVAFAHLDAGRLVYQVRRGDVTCH